MFSLLVDKILLIVFKALLLYYFLEVLGSNTTQGAFLGWIVAFMNITAHCAFPFFHNSFVLK